MDSTHSRQSQMSDVVGLRARVLDLERERDYYKVSQVRNFMRYRLIRGASLCSVHARYDRLKDSGYSTHFH